MAAPHHNDDAQLLAQHQKLLDDLERGIRVANREIITRHVKRKVKGDDVMRLAIAVAELRARYLDQALRLIDREKGVVPDSAEIKRLAAARETYDEALHAFEAFRRAIERGYVDVEA
ncbi:MAG: hypothetical protein FJX46_10480 [Alphaproteobacteria bacterium]|nr:hypothetical protein [Alphaproteobacteria bacterium]